MKLFIAGTSIFANYKAHQFPLTGVGMTLGLYLKDDVIVRNFARPGRSTKSYIAQGHLAALEKEIGEGDYMLIEFGHNDEKVFDTDRYTAPFGEYKENIKKMVDVARNAGATPILVSSLERRAFMDGSRMWADPTMDPKTPTTLQPSGHTEYVAAMKQLAEEENVAFIDLCAKSREKMEAAGPVETTKWFMNIAPGEYPAYPNGLFDNTHLNIRGQWCLRDWWQRGLRNWALPLRIFCLKMLDFMRIICYVSC